ncbi:probable sulfate transporter 3.4 [Phalaenopsis equestris]|uniref:probable sulfate transporter 3.4 n=1 Tax=Phalaenopsis equestris TaxID=78828 RepID=UPI0009E42BC3|nr:probable sulfate transporter 3.4 [Phalaenopsis equestris]
MYLQDRILRWVRDEEERAAKLKEGDIKCIVLDISAVTAIDASGIDALLELKKALNNRSLQLVLVNPVAGVAEKLYLSDALEKLGSECIYMRVSEAVIAISCKLKDQP